MSDLDSIPTEGSFIAVTASTTALLDHIILNPRQFGTLNLIIAHDLHALDAAYELLLSRLRWSHPTTRIVGSSACLSDATDLSAWLGVPPRSTYSFSPSTRSSALSTSFQSFSTVHSASLLRSMIKPAYEAMRLTTGSTICFVPSRAQARATVHDLVTQTASDLEESFIAAGARETIEAYAQSVRDPELAEALTHGIAVYHEGLRPEEQRIALELFGTGVVRVLVAAREACWTLPVRSNAVIVMSAQYAVVRKDSEEREMKGYSMAELLQMQSLAIAASSDRAAECLILCQTEQADLYARYLGEGVPLESELMSESDETMLREMVWVDLGLDRITSRQDVVDMLSWTYLARRVESNPSYYRRSHQAGAEASSSIEQQLSRIGDTLLASIEARCGLLFSGKTELKMTELGRLFTDQGFTLGEIERLQAASLEKLVELSSSSSSSPSSKDSTSLNEFHSKLPRAIRDLIGIEKEDAEVGEYRRRILLAAFSQGRVPRGENHKLELEQAQLIRTILDAFAE